MCMCVRERERETVRERSRGVFHLCEGSILCSRGARGKRSSEACNQHFDKIHNTLLSMLCGTVANKSDLALNDSCLIGRKVYFTVHKEEHA